jgi:hypothetical protein
MPLEFKPVLPLQYSLEYIDAIRSCGTSRVVHFLLQGDAGSGKSSLATCIVNGQTDEVGLPFAVGGEAQLKTRGAWFEGPLLIDHLADRWGVPVPAELAGTRALVLDAEGFGVRGGGDLDIIRAELMIAAVSSRMTLTREPRNIELEDEDVLFGLAGGNDGAPLV